MIIRDTVVRALAASFAAGLAVQSAGAAEGTHATQFAPIPNQYIVVFKSDALLSQPPGGERTSATVASELVTRYGAEIKRTFDHALRGALIVIDSNRIKQITNDPRVAYVEVDAVYKSQSVISDVVVQDQPGWGLDRIDQNSLPRDDRYVYPTSAGRGVHAYVLDGAILVQHPEFENRIGNGASFSEDLGTPAPPVPGHPVPQSTNTACYDHGTSVASVLGGTQSGVAKLVTVHPVRVLNCSGQGSTSGVIAGLDWVRENHVKPAVVNMSLSGPPSQAMRDAAAALVSAGVTVVASAGNDSTDACSYSPGNLGQVLTVAASVMQDDSLWSLSNYGSCVDIKAPGVQVATANAADVFDNPGGGVSGIQRSGTSFAAPYVAGAVALLLSKYPDATPGEVSATLLANVGSTGVLRTSFLLTTGVPSAPGSFATRSNGCYGENTISWDPIAGSTRYELWASARSTFANSWLFGQYPNTQAIGDFPTVTHLHVRACNWWGCSGFSSAKTSKLSSSCG